MGLRSGEQFRVYDANMEDLFEAAIKVAGMMGMNVVSMDKANGFLKATSGLSFLSAGSEISVQMNQQNGETSVMAKGRPKVKITLIDYGRSAREVTRFMDLMEQVLQIQPKHHSDKIPVEGEEVEENVSKCPSCEAPISATDKFCTNCGEKLSVESE
ncbi:MAG: hypothetical protein DRG59_12205 [Deltaproteobacteria bacterium]|nr:MAG: hypothetical protein DRG59_12205 [Deltaproteobacteria bacterium]HEC32103.1 zinc ribbon domain-containing protein [Deltaproteobacteria bacterium]